ncbi:DUF2637 domain-containing protein [Micromonospora sp. CA-248089]|uniref:DUF2637 domain-containing protein n=1 Tax=Micromonospora sp. CA-248089 TaxID=3239960 RepID=UPI003D8EC9AC
MSPLTSPTTRTEGNSTSEAATDVAVVHLKRLRWAVRATLTLGVAASVAANVLHARPNPISQIIAAWPPLALLLTVELISRVPHHRRSLGIIRMAATSVIAAIATWVSYWHLVGVAARYGEAGAGAAYLLPISVDGLVIVASVSLVELTARIRAGQPEQHPQLPVAATPSPASTTRMPHAASAGRRDEGTADASSGAGASADPVPCPDPPQRRPQHDAGDGERRPRRHLVDVANARVQRPSAASAVNGEPAVNGDQLVPSETAAAVAYWHRREPHLHPAEIAARIGRSERTVRRYWPPRPQTPPAANENHAGDLTEGART